MGRTCARILYVASKCHNYTQNKGVLAGSGQNYQVCDERVMPWLCIRMYNLYLRGKTQRPAITGL
jgi:hypothetical protein